MRCCQPLYPSVQMSGDVPDQKSCSVVNTWTASCWASRESNPKDLQCSSGNRRGTATSDECRASRSAVQGPMSRNCTKRNKRLGITAVSQSLPPSPLKLLMRCCQPLYPSVWYQVMCQIENLAALSTRGPRAAGHPENPARRTCSVVAAIAGEQPCQMSAEHHGQQCKGPMSRNCTKRNKRLGLIAVNQSLQPSPLNIYSSIHPQRCGVGGFCCSHHSINRSAYSDLTYHIAWSRQP